MSEKRKITELNLSSLDINIDWSENWGFEVDFFNVSIGMFFGSLFYFNFGYYKENKEFEFSFDFLFLKQVYLWFKDKIKGE